MSRSLTSARRHALGAGCLLVALAAAVLPQAAQATGGRGAAPAATSSVRGSDGRLYTATNHLVAAGAAQHQEYLLAWTGAADPAEPDFIAVLGATPGSREYGRVVNTVTMSPQLQNEAHHMQYTWHRGDRLFAGGILSDTTYVLDLSGLPALRLVGVNTPTDTPCGSAPDAFATLHDGRAYVSYLGGPDVSGACRYTDGQVRIGNGYIGSPGEVVLMDRNGRTIAEIPAATAAGEDPALCTNIPALPKASCANPHGVQVREDLNRLVVSDFAEIRSLLGDNPVFDPHLIRNTVRIFDISHRTRPVLTSVSHLPDGPRAQAGGFNDAESRVVMESAVTHRHQHRGAFASTMWGGAIYYTPDITVAVPQWREVFDDSTAYGAFHPDGSVGGGGDGGAWLELSADDRYLFHTVVGTQFNVPLSVTTGMVYVLDVRKLLAAGDDPRCAVDTLAESAAGGSELDCPALAGVLPIDDPTTGGPHWAALDNFRRGADGYLHETSSVSRLAVADYFLTGFHVDGDHRVCMVRVGTDGKLTLDPTFRDENSGQPCVSFNRAAWPHGAAGDARPHGVLFVAADRSVR